MTLSRDEFELSEEPSPPGRDGETRRLSVLVAGGETVEIMVKVGEHLRSLLGPWEVETGEGKNGVVRVGVGVGETERDSLRDVLGKVRVSSKQTPPRIKREKKVVDGRELERVVGSTEYRMISPPVGSEVRVVVVVDDEEVASLGPWTVQALEGKYPRVQVRMLVDDSADTPDVNPPKEPEE